MLVVMNEFWDQVQFCKLVNKLAIFGQFTCLNFWLIFVKSLLFSGLAIIDMTNLLVLLNYKQHQESWVLSLTKHD